jgi:transposase InsO family protein
LQDAIDRYGQPEIFNTDQGVQFTSGDFIVISSRPPF